MAAIDEIIKWAQSIPAWQGDAVRRLLEAGENPLSAADEAELLALAKAGLKIGLATTNKPSPPSAGMFSSKPPVPQAISLLSIEEIKNVNAIQNGTSITFGKTGLTVVYGNNGAGKSGFTRILKMSCNARDKEDRVLANVFALPTGSPTATIHLELNGAPVPIQWTQGKPSDVLVNQISVFDARCARVITDERNEMTYMPYGADVFEKLAKLITKFRTAIESEISQSAPIKDTAIVAKTTSASFVEGLTGFTEQSEIDAASKWNPSDEKRLLEVEELIRTAGSDSASLELARLNRLRNHVEGIRASVDAQEAALSLISEEKVGGTLNAVHTAQQAHELAVSETDKEPLPGVGLAPAWKAMYEAAKEYSQQIAYPGLDFPHLEPGAVCVLCQQSISGGAKERFARFYTFMSDATANALQKSRDSLTKLRQDVQAIPTQDIAALSVICDGLVPFDAALPDELRTFQDSINARKEAILLALGDQKVGPPTSLPKVGPSISARISEAVMAISTKAEVIAKSMKPEEQIKLASERDELRARKALSSRKEDIKKYVETEKKNLQLRVAASELKTNDVTKRGTALIRASLTPELLKAFQAELQRLGVDHLPLSVRSLGASGETLHEIKFEGVQLPPKTRLSDVLSEGETRVIAIAGFLAELAIAGDQNPIVLDDPVSSLDHVYTAAIAKRLAEVALHRQVVTFTHNIAFLMEIQDAVTELGNKQTPIKIEVKTLRKQGAFAGVATGGVPWHGMKINQRAAYLEKVVNQIKVHFQADMETYNKEAAYVYGLLREAWEASIEEDVFSAVVSRYRNSVKTLQLAEVEISDKDVHTIDLNMSKCSTWMTGHDKSKALHSDRPSPADLLSDIKALRDFSLEIMKRRETTRARRKAQTQPSPSVG
jgi:energy-coupling factor transporter ATP-binding protein EcfA2